MFKTHFTIAIIFVTLSNYIDKNILCVSYFTPREQKKPLDRNKLRMIWRNNMLPYTQRSRSLLSTKLPAVRNHVVNYNIHKERYSLQHRTQTRKETFVICLTVIAYSYIELL